ncbi:uncharacterized protein NPIL_543501 [Nephila pilipes]|uniref:Uncharacterized protein n=1 Tax=Nephila pilipes TaxID=299642 RepID=A0A8X6T632_NEPPI|nr:uncharacterized protein NPIL_543501 [Nephila pilipes]
MNFKDFVSTVHFQTSLSNSQKFQYLKDLLSDEPASLIKHIPLSNDSYQEARGKLMDRYDKKKKIIHALIKTFLNQKSISQANLANLRNIVDTSDEVLRGLKALGKKATSKDLWLIQLLLQKLDPETRRLWSVKTSDTEFPTWEEFLEFLNTRCSSLKFMVYDESEVKIPTRLSLSGISGVPAGTTRGSVVLKIGSRFNEELITINAYTLNKVASQIPIMNIDIKELDYLKGVPLSDEDFSRSSECDII